MMEQKNKIFLTKKWMNNNFVIKNYIIVSAVVINSPKEINLT